MWCVMIWYDMTNVNLAYRGNAFDALDNLTFNTFSARKKNIIIGLVDIF